MTLEKMEMIIGLSSHTLLDLKSDQLQTSANLCDLGGGGLASIKVTLLHLVCPKWRPSPSHHSSGSVTRFTLVFLDGTQGFGVIGRLWAL